MTRDIFYFLVFVGLVFLLFTTYTSERGDTTYHITIDTTHRTIEFPQMDVNIPVPPPSRIEIIERSVPSTEIPDSLIRKMYEQIRTEYDSLNKVRSYTQAIEDSNATGQLDIKVRGYLLKQDLKYKIKPITVVDSTKTKIYDRKYLRFYAGGGINSELSPSVDIDITKDKALFGVSYEPMRKTFKAKFGWSLFKIKQK